MHKSAVFLAVIMVAAFLIRISLMPFDAPVEEDAKVYYYCAAELAYNQQHAIGCDYLHNLGWSYFLAAFFGMIPRDMAGFELLSNIQRIITVFISVATIPLIYRFTRNFLNWKLALVGSALFAFEYRIIENSTFGITEPLFLLLSVGALYFATAKRYNHLGFILALAATTIRVEGLFLFAAVAILYYHTTRQTKFCLVWLAVIIIPVLTFGVTQFQHEMLVADMHVNGNDEKDLLWSIGNSFLYMGWSTFPNFIFLIPLGLYAVYKQRQFRLWFALLAITAAPGLWSYLDAYDTRYFFPLYPFLVILSLVYFQKKPIMKTVTPTS